MAAKRRLTNDRRDTIIRYMRKVVRETTFKANLDEVAEADIALAALALKYARVAWPKKDMDVLRKYDLVEQHDDVKFIFRAPNGKENWQSFSFGHDKDGNAITIDGPSGYNNKIVVDYDHPLRAAWLALSKLQSETSDVIDKLDQKYNMFIRNAQSFEEVVEIIPETAVLEEQLYETRALTVVPSEVIADIRKDVAQRAA